MIIGCTECSLFRMRPVMRFKRKERLFSRPFLTEPVSGGENPQFRITTGSQVASDGNIRIRTIPNTCSPMNCIIPA